MAESWTLKLDRAEKHLVELAGRIDVVDVHSGLYRVEGPEKAEGYEDVWVFRLHVTPDPDPELAVVVGEVLHNTRAALDHIAVALVPRGRRYSASFPIAMADPWKDTATYACVHDDPRQRFESAVRGAPKDAVALIKEAQPYASTAGPSELHPLGLLSSLENADKHRALSVVTWGLKDVSAVILVDGLPMPPMPQKPGLYDDGAVIASFRYVGAEPLVQRKVEVAYGGTALVSLHIVGRQKTYLDVAELGTIVGYARLVVSELEPYVEPRRR